MKNEEKINYDDTKKIKCLFLFCLKCHNLILIKKIFLDKYLLNLVCKCECSKYNKTIPYQQLMTTNMYIYEKFVIRNNYFLFMKNNNYYSFMKNNNWEINKNNTEQKINEYECNCNQDKIKYCIDCHKFICKQCKILHYYHRQFYFEPNNYINDKDLHKLEKYCYQSYINLKKSIETAKSQFIKLVIAKKKSLNFLNDYINHYTEINDSLYSLFTLLLKTFKVSRTLTNYLNLSHFGYCNKPFNFEVLMKKSNRMKKQYNLIELFIQYCKSIFLIPITSNYKFFSFEKEIKFTYKANPPPPPPSSSSSSKYESRNIVPPFFKICADRDMKVKHLKGEIIKNHANKGPFKLFFPVRIEKIFLLFGNKLLLQFCHYPCFAVYSFDIKNKIFSFNYVISCHSLSEKIFQLNNSTLLLLKDNCTTRIIIKENTYEEKNISWHKGLFCIELNNQRLLILTTTGLLYMNLKQSKEYPFDIERYAKYTFGFKLSNNLILIN